MKPTISNPALGFLVALFLGGSFLLPYQQPWFLLGYIALTGVMLASVRQFHRLGGLDAPALGFTLPHAGWGLAAIPLGILTLFAANLFGLGVSEATGENLDELNETFLQTNTGSLMLYSLLTVAVVVPIVEEVVFRGVLFAFIGRYVGPIATVFIVALIFGLAHSGALSAAASVKDQVLIILVISTVGVSAGLVRHYSGSLIPAMMVHGVYNALIFLLAQVREDLEALIEEGAEPAAETVATILPLIPA